MNGKYWLIGLFMLLLDGLYAQTCIHTDLSKRFDYKLTRSITHKNEYGSTNAKITLIIIQKSNKAIVQKISFDSGLLFADAYQHCNACRSYITNKNKNAEVADYGDLIIADLNFDGKEDIAIKYDSGGNGGPIYNYYIQGKNGQFKKDDYLSENVWPFPESIDATHKTLIVITHANVSQQRETTFKYDKVKKKWRVLKSVLINS